MWQQYSNLIREMLAGMTVTDGAGVVLEPDAGFERWTTMAQRVGEMGSLYLIGNGASASLASHFAADVTKNCGLRAGVFTDCALITALGNDEGYENGYAVALNRYARAGDLLIAISSSGASQNILNACAEARRLGMNIVTVSAKKPDNPLRALGDLNFYVSAPSFSLAESAHAVILHHWTDRLECGHRGNG